jgi:hypothetical protein
MVNLSRWYSWALVALVIVLCPVSVSAQAVALTHEGSPGVWFPLADAREALGARVERDSLRARLTLCDESLSIADSQADNLRSLVEASATEIERAGASVDAAIARAIAAESERDAWYRSPFLWTAIGLVVGAGVVLAAVFGAGT